VKKIMLLILILMVSFFFILYEKPLTINAKTSDLTPTLSHEGGFYTESFWLTIIPKSNTVVYYTLDGSTPNEQSLKYQEPLLIEETWIDQHHEEVNITKSTEDILSPISFIRTSEAKWKLPQGDIFKATVLKVIAIDKVSKDISEVITETYFVADDMFERYQFPIFSLTTDNHHLYDYETGIHIPGKYYDYAQDNPSRNRTGNYFQTGDAWEKPVYVELFTNSGLKVMAQHAGLRIHGGLSRQYPIKSYRLYARREYDEKNTFDYPFFENDLQQSYKRLVLRNGGQAYQYTFFGDAFVHQLLKPLNLDIQDNLPVILFMNGEYFGIRNLRERLDTHYLNAYYRLNEHEVTMLVGHAYHEDGSKRGSLHYQTLYAYANTRDLKSDKRFSTIERWMDTDNFIDYMIAELYTGNSDWPQNNILYWRKNTSYQPHAPYGHDGRWRWMITDMDASFGISFGTNLPEVNSLERMTGDSWKTGKLFVNLLKNEQFKARFIYRYHTLMDTIFEADRVEEELDAMIALYEKEMEEHIFRYGYPASMTAWYNYTERMRTFAKERKGYVIDHLEDYFSLEQKHDLKIVFQASKGEVSFYDTINQQGLIETKVYDRLLLNLKALAKEGYYFDGWYKEDMKISGEETLLLRPDQAIELEARFLEGENPQQTGSTLTPIEITFSAITLISVASLIVIIKKKR